MSQAIKEATHDDEAKHARNHIGTVSLAIAAAGFTATEIAYGSGLAAGPGWMLTRLGFEAAVIGGVADWFAVRAIFHPVPGRPFRALPHTNLILSNRDKLTDGLVELVETQLLSPHTLKEQLRAFSATGLIIEYLETPAGRAGATDAVLSLAQRFSDDIDNPTFRQFAVDIMREQVREAELSPVVGRWLLQRVESGDATALWMTIAATLAEEAQAGGFDEFFEDALAATVAAAKKESWKGWAAGFLISPKKDAVRVRNAIAKVLTEQSLLPAHILNEKLDGAVRRFAERLIANDHEATNRVRKLQTTVADHAKFDDLISQLIGDLQRALKSQTRTSASPLRNTIYDVIRRGTERLRGDPDAQLKLDDWARRSLSELASRYHSVIGSTARKSLNKLSGDQLVAELDAKVGQDLQFIRLNGAVVGGIVGVAIGATRLLFT